MCSRPANDPLKGIGSLPDNHPYHLVGEDAVKTSLEMFKAVMSEEGGAYVGDAHVNRKILTPLGKHKVTCLVPGTMEFADFDSDEYIHVISFNKMKDFYPNYITSNYKNAGCSIFDAGISTTIGIAERLENRQFLKKLYVVKRSRNPGGKDSHTGSAWYAFRCGCM